MYNLQLIILIGVLLVIIIAIIYYYRREKKIQNIIKNSFNQATKDVILNNQAIVLDGISQQKVDTWANKSVTNVDISQATIAKEKEQASQFSSEKVAAPKGQIENSTANITAKNLDIKTNRTPIHLESNIQDSIALQPNQAPSNVIPNEITDLILDYHLNIAFKENKTIKYLPDLSHLTTKEYKYYAFNKDGTKIPFKSGKKHSTKQIELEVTLIDHNGLINQAQIANIYNEIEKLTASEEVTLNGSDYVNDIIKIGNQLKHLTEIKLNLVLSIAYLAPSKDMLRFLTKKLVMQNNSFALVDKDNNFICTIQPAKDTDSSDYKLLSLNCAMHLQHNPSKSLDAMFDFIELLGAEFDIRILNHNHSLFNQTNYDAIYSNIAQYMAKANKNGIILGSNLIKRIFND